MNSKDINPWRERLPQGIENMLDHGHKLRIKDDAKDAEISELRRALKVAEAQVTALSFIRGKGLTDCDMHDDESN